MLLVIFGAGASYDSVQSDNLPAGTRDGSQPPLADHLFDNRPTFGTAIDYFRECRPIVPRLRDRSHDRTVEQVMQEILMEADTYPIRHKQIAAIRFYLQRIIHHTCQAWHSLAHGLTNYSLLVDTLEDWRGRSDEQICYLTFNYDHMLEEAFEDVYGRRFHTIGSYIEDAAASLIKIHGSVDWGQRLAAIDQLPGDQTRWMIENAAHLDLTTTIDVVGPETRVNGDHLLLPALAIPVEAKAEFVCPDDHLAVLEGAVAAASRVLVIGWSATERHFLTWWRDRAPKEPTSCLLAHNNASASADVYGKLPLMGDHLSTQFSFSSLVNEPGRDVLRDWLRAAP